MIFWEQNGRRNTEAEFEPYTRCLAINPNHVSAINNLGNVLKSVRALKRAGQEAHKALPTS